MRRDETLAKLARVRELLDARSAPAAVLTGAAAVAWATAGLTSPIERGHPASPIWLVVTPDDAVAVTTNVERPRLDAEADLGALGLALEEVPWHGTGAFARAASELAGASLRAAVTDDPALGAGADDLVALRLALLPAERERLAALSADAAAALEAALREWRPGTRDLDVQARAAELLERVGALAVCLIVGGDERVERFRHPLASGAPMERLVLAVVVAERGGLHAAATRFASAGPLPARVAAAREAALAVEAGVLAASKPGATYGEALAALDAAYASAGHPGAWREHYQGGPLGYRQREFELAPTDRASRWYAQPIEVGHALAWNPSVAGGGKAEDTFLVEPDGLRCLTETGAWPLVEVAGGRPRPAALEIATGGAA